MSYSKTLTMTKFMSRYEWEKLLESSYTVMPKWYYNKSECDRRYDEYCHAFNRNNRNTEND